jgi:hypothetical protein
MKTRNAELESTPRWGSIHDATTRFPLSRSAIYALCDKGLIGSRVVRPYGPRSNGRRILDLWSIAQYINDSPRKQTAAVRRSFRELAQHRSALKRANAKRKAKGANAR